MRKKIFPIAIAVAVSALFILPGIASGEGRGTPSPPPSNPPCDSDAHNGQPPPYNGPNQNSGSCDNGTGTATGDGTGGATGGTTSNACPPNSQNPDGTPPDCGHATTGGTTGGETTGNPTTGNPTTGNPTTGATTGGAVNECTWSIVLGGNTVTDAAFAEGVLGVHLEVPPDEATHSEAPIGVAHACLGIGSIVTPDGGGQCPTGTQPIEAQTDQASYLLLCALL
jgi:hypothetical protein